MQRLRVRAVPPSVAPMIRSTAARAPPVRRSRSPRMRTRTPCSRSSCISCAMYSSSRLISASISSAGRCQFSWLNANSDSTPTPASRHPSTTSRTELIPAAWPSGRGSDRPVAQRPLPSMMMATCAGTTPCIRTRCRASALIRLHFHDLGLFGMDQAVDLLDVVVGEFLDVLLGPGLVVAADVLELLDLAQRVGAGVADRDLAFLGELVHDLDQLL